MNLQEKQIQAYIIQNLRDMILEQTNSHNRDKLYQIYKISIDLLKTSKQNQRITTSIVCNYPRFLRTLEKTLNQIVCQQNIRRSNLGNKISVSFENCIIPRSNIKSIDFLTACIHQNDNGILVYLKDAEIISIKQSQLYLQSWTQFWEYNCQCNSKAKNMIYRKKITQSLLDIITKGTGNNLKQNCKERQTVLCADCNSSLLFHKIDQYVYDQCQQIQIMCQMKHNDNETQLLEFINVGSIKILANKSQTEGLIQGSILDLCCYLKPSIQLNRNLFNSGKVFSDARYLIYLICWYPPSSYLTSTNNLFFNRIQAIELEQLPITSWNSVNDIVKNYKSFMEAINQIRFPYIPANTLTALKMITLSSTFSHQINQQKLNLFIITDEVEIFMKYLQIHDLSIKKFPSIYDEKTISNFFNSCHNSIVLIINPQKKQHSIINKILRKQIYNNLNFVLWILCEPDQNLKRKIQIKEIDIILDLTINKNLNVCQDVYLTMIDTFLQSFTQDTEQYEVMSTVQKNIINQRNLNQTLGRARTQNEQLKQERLANDILKRYFLKSRQCKITKFNNLQSLTKIAESFMCLRYFIKNKGFNNRGGNNSIKKTQYLSVMDVILAIFIEQETSRNKYSASNTLFADEVSKIMLNESNCNVSIWEYEYDNDYMQQSKNFISRDQLVGRVLLKLFHLIFED